jgi:hypothetical protein
MLTSILKWSGAFAVGMLVGCYTAFVAQAYWNWFAVPALHASEVSFLQMLGLIWLIQLLASRPTGADDTRWRLLASAVELCVPAERQEELAELSKPDSVHGWYEGFSQVFGQLVGNTFTLVAGFVLHSFV